MKIMKRSLLRNYLNDKKRIYERQKRQQKRRYRSSRNNKKSKRQSSSHKSTSRRYSFLNEITVPDWERISPNIDQILSDKHTQAGVYAHEIHLIQQELEALLSMAIIRHDLFCTTNIDRTNSRIHQHQQTENIYSMNKISSKPLPPLPPLINQQHNGPHLLFDRQVSTTPVLHAYVDQIWSDLNTHYRQISSNDMTKIRNLLEFHQQFEDKIRTYKNDYRNKTVPQLDILQKLNDENLEELNNISQTNPVITNYTKRTVLERFQTNLYEHIERMSSISKTYTNRSHDGKFFNRKINRNSLPRSSPRLHRNDLTALSNVVTLDRVGTMQTTTQLVHDYLSDQHSHIDENVDSKRKRKLSTTLRNVHCRDTFESKLSTLVSLLHECSTLSSCALQRARLQLNNEQTWQRLQTIEHDMKSLVEKIESTGDNDDGDNSTTRKKNFQSLDRLLKDWTKHEDEFDRQLHELFVVF